MLLGVVAGSEEPVTGTTQRLDVAIATIAKKMGMFWEEDPYNKLCERSFARSAVLAALARADKINRNKV